MSAFQPFAIKLSAIYLVCLTVLFSSCEKDAVKLNNAEQNDLKLSGNHTQNFIRLSTEYDEVIRKKVQLNSPQQRQRDIATLDSLRRSPRTLEGENKRAKIFGFRDETERHKLSIARYAENDAARKQNPEFFKKSRQEYMQSYSEYFKTRRQTVSQ